MARGRKQGPELVQFKAWIPKDLAEKVDLMLLDPVRMRTEYGARSGLVVSLLRKWLEERSNTHE